MNGKRGAATVAALLALVGCSRSAPPPEVPLVVVAAGAVRYQLPAAAQPVTQRIATFRVMARQVSQADYTACVRGGGCLPLSGNRDESGAGERPAVGLSWQDGNAYAGWLSAATGVRYRLPRYGEWLLAVGQSYVDDAPLVDDPANPAQRWLAEYAREASRSSPSLALSTFAEQGRSVSGALSVAENVWEWTDSCFGRDDGRPAADGFCGIRIAAGRHPSALSDFIRDPVSGACSVGIPPTYVGLRLVRDEN
jgi:formylglycine-generating enzyme required for sulfatase activity